jgi:hypothetical protein
MAEELASNWVVLKSEIGAGRSPVASSPAIKSPASIAYDEWKKRESNSASSILDWAPATSSVLPPIRVSKLKKRPIRDEATYEEYRRICEALVLEVGQAYQYLVGDSMDENGVGVVVEVEQLLDRLYRCEWGAPECLKRVVVAIWSQTNNVRWAGGRLFDCY